MAYNLLSECWIPVVRASGRHDDVAPWQFTDPADPPLRIESPRPDFDGALLQLLIGLVQTTAAPETKAGWREAFRAPPPPEHWRERFATVKAAFDLDGDGPRFMQDLDFAVSELEPKPISALLIEAPGEKTVEDNKDLFVKRGFVEQLGRPMAAAALLTLQSNAPSGGQGHRTSLRGGGPLTTLLLGENLFQTVWLNVLRRDAFESLPGDPDRTDLGAKFPWMAPTRTSEKGQPDTTPAEVHPAQHFWAMPRRIRLDFRTAVAGVCGLSGRPDARVIRGFSTQNYGPSYKGAFAHPLTPYTRMDPGQPPNPKKLGGDGLPYRDWPHYAGGDESRTAAAVVRAYLVDERHDAVGQLPRLFAFGFDMDNMKPLAWYAGTHPLVHASAADHDALVAAAEKAVMAAESVRKTLGGRLRDALDRRAELKIDSAFFAALHRSFWSSTEPGFFRTVEELRDAVVADDEDAKSAAYEAWLRDLNGAAKRLFTLHSQEVGVFAATDVRRVAKAWQALCRFTHWKNKKLRELVGLGEVEEERLAFPPEEVR